MGKIKIVDEMDPRVKNFIRSNIDKTEKEIIAMVREHFDYPHAPVYVCDMVHHIACDIERGKT